jgi:hypothetical protein
MQGRNNQSYLRDLPKRRCFLTQIAGTFSTKITHISNKLKRLTAEEDSEERNNEINLAVDSLSYRFAAMGKERRSSINECYRQIINLGVPVVHRYFLWAASNACHIFRAQNQIQSEDEAWFAEMEPSLQGVIPNEPIRQVRGAVRDKKEQIIGLVNKLCKAKKKMEDLCEDIDQCLVDVRDVFSPIQMARFLIFEETYRYREELRSH